MSRSGLSSDSPLLDYARVIYRRRGIALSVLLVVVLGVAAYTFTTPPMYEGQAVILIESASPNVVSFEEVLDEGRTLSNYYQTQYELLQSRALARRTVEALKLSSRPGFGVPAEPPALSAGAAASAVTGSVEALAVRLRARVAPAAAPAGETRDDAAAASQAAASAVQAGLRIVPIRGSRIVHVRFRSPDPDVAAEIANGHARQYIEQSLELRYLASKEATEWLGERLDEERQRVEKTEAALQAYREQHDVVSLEEGQDIILQRLADLNAAATRAKTDRIASEAQYRQLMGLQQDRAALDTLPAILANPIIQQIKIDLARLQREYAQMSETLGERHPILAEKRSALETTAARLDREIGTVVEAVRNEYRAAVALEASLTALLEEQKKEALALNRRDIEYGVLEREVESTRLVYENLLQRANETGVARELRASSIRLIDAALPPGSPVSPRPGFNLAMALLTGSLLGVGFAFLREHVDDRIKTPDDIRTHLGLAFLGLIPEVPATPGQDHPLMTGSVPSSFLESVRALRTSVVSRALGGGLESMMVASAEAGEGKSLVAANLAIALAEAQQRVVLIDADLRQPAVHRIFGARSSPGLADVLASGAALDEVLRATDTPGLSVIPAGPPARNAPELLGSPRFQELLETLRDRFDWAIVDSAPVLTVTDASVVASRTSGVVFVVGAEMTSRRAAELALERLQQAGGVIVGGLLNRANLERHGFYFAPYSPHEYGSAAPAAGSGYSGIFGRLASARES